MTAEEAEQVLASLAAVIEDEISHQDKTYF
jgi:hypothetical protein